MPMTDGQNRHDQRKHDRQAERIDDTRQHVACGVIGAEPMVGIGRRRRGAAQIVDCVVGIGDQRPEDPASRAIASPFTSPSRGIFDQRLGVVPAFGADRR